MPPHVINCGPGPVSCIFTFPYLAWSYFDQLNVLGNDNDSSSQGSKGPHVFLFTLLIASDFCHENILQVAIASLAWAPDQG